MLGEREKGMALLFGIAGPPGEGMVIEVHLDIMEANDAFLHRLNELGFEDDPFLDFFPPEYRFHYTGRTRAPQGEVHNILPGIDRLIEEVIAEAREAGIRLYAECELVREIRHFEDDGAGRGLAALDGFSFKGVRGGEAKADVHVEFESETVTDEVRALLVERRFYWVRTPASERFPSEEIATLQTSVFHEAQLVYDRLVSDPLPGCTGIHLEQKLAMIGSHPGLRLPEVVAVSVGT